MQENQKLVERMELAVKGVCRRFCHCTMLLTGSLLICSYVYLLHLFHPVVSTLGGSTFFSYHLFSSLDGTSSKKLPRGFLLKMPLIRIDRSIQAIPKSILSTASVIHREARSGNKAYAVKTSSGLMWRAIVAAFASNISIFMGCGVTIAIHLSALLAVFNCNKIIKPGTACLID
jgi:hypothetical protein